MEKISAFFNNEKDLQMAMNSLVQAGYDTINLSLVMKDVSKNEGEGDEPFDEENEMDDAEGTIWAIDSEDLDTEPISVPGIGEILIAGPIVAEMDKVEFEESEDIEQKRFDDALKILGIADENLTDFENRIKNGQIFISMNLDQDSNKEEIEMYFSDQGATLFDVF